jgi:hypothetical protein
MWYRTENGSNVKPDALDTTSSKKWNYVRKDFELIPAVEGEHNPIPEHWTWMENKVSKEDWEVYTNVAEHGEALDDVYAALTELAELIG